MTKAARELVTTERLREFFAPRSIALVGASDNSGWARLLVASCKTAGFEGPLTAVHPRAGQRVRPAGGTEPARPARARRHGLHPGARTGGRGRTGRHGRNRHTERGGACLGLPRNRIARPGARGRARGPCHRQQRHHPGPELPGVRQCPHPFGALCPDVAGPADRRPGRGGAAERRPGQRGAGLRPGARHRPERAHLDGQRGHDEDRRRARLPGRGRGDQGDLPVPGGDRRPGGLRRGGGQGGPGGQADRGAQGRLEPGRPAGRDGPHRLGGRGRRGGRRGAAPAQRHPGHQPGGAADHRGGPRLQPLAGRPADGRADPVRRLVRHHRRRGQRAGPGHPGVLGANGNGNRRAPAAVRHRAEPAGRHRLRHPGQPVRPDRPADRRGPRAGHRGAGPQPGLRAVLRAGAARAPAAGRGPGHRPGDPRRVAGRADGVGPHPGHPGRDHLRGHQRLRAGAAHQARAEHAQRA